MLPTLLRHELGVLRDLMVTSLSVGSRATPQLCFELLGQGLRHVLLALVVLGSSIMLVGVAGALAQGGFYLATKAVKPKLSKLNPIKGAKRIFGVQSLWEGAKMLVKSSIVGGLVWGAVKGLTPLLGGLVPIPVVIASVSAAATGLIRNVALAGLVMAGADYGVQRRRVGKQTRMTKQEVKQEHKQSEGDPMLKG